MASKYNKLPSEIIDEGHALPAIARYLVNKAVTFFGMAIENALAETVEEGSAPHVRSRQKYTLPELLDDAFRLPRPKSRKAQSKAVGEQVKALFGGGASKRKGKGNAPQVTPLLRKWLERHRDKIQ